MKTKAVSVAFVIVFVMAAWIPFGSSSSIVPAFLWSPHQNSKMKEAVNYQTISPKDLAKSVFSDGGWSSLLCSRKNLQASAEVALVFVGSRMQTVDVSGNKFVDPDLVDLLKNSFARSNLSMAFPYIAAAESTSMESSLISEFIDMCGNDIQAGNIAVTESCSVEGEDLTRLSGLQSLHEYLNSRIGKRSNGDADLVVFCHPGSGFPNKLGEQDSEGDIVSKVISSVEQSGATYSVLYVSDPSKSIHHPFSGHLERFLVEGTSGNGSANSTCDEVCQIKSSLLEGLLVGGIEATGSIICSLKIVSRSMIELSRRKFTSVEVKEGLVLLIILISGLCCMAGIDTPTRFEVPQDL
ncbi:V-type proton ATPase subunit S1/VOA1, transmembrane domain [Dillenia turbinata]|uniref:V-type proton ATPase subunit S1/VOA1, transmembrane domain n=1 Tax=Dillenia turbinata TaxID=194707 RepID=A0AAN8UQG5_9MAGN